MSKNKSNYGMGVIFGALLIQLSLGAIYAWSVFAKPLQAGGWSTSDTQWPFTVGLVIVSVPVSLYIVLRIVLRLVTAIQQQSSEKLNTSHQSKEGDL